MGRPDAGQKDYARWINNMTTVAYTDSSARSTILAQGSYWLRATTNCYFLQGGSGVTATTAANFLAAGERVRMDVSGDDTNGDAYVSVIRETTSGTLQIYQPA